MNTTDLIKEAADTMRPRTWEECRDLAVYLGGPNPALPATTV
jgi:hypothetical protein